eukprot:GEMP01102505.1.p1 GENE.GEMP01102505.1~~GEMP01102505.1.p1  ORF type:complete len:253 (+),score=33.84 GEMP01102505.1:31-759(+)
MVQIFLGMPYMYIRYMYIYAYIRYASIRYIYIAPVEVQSLKNDIWRLKKERTDEREKNRKYVASLKKIVQDGAQEVTANRQQYLEAQQKLEKALVEVDGSRREVATANEMMAEMETKLKAERRQALSSRLKSQLKLQILAPHVTVTVGAGEATDAESAPSPDSIRKVMMEQVLPKFAHVIVGDENDNSVEEVIEDMLKSIEARLIGIFGRSCRGTAQHNSRMDISSGPGISTTRNRRQGLWP